MCFIGLWKDHELLDGIILDLVVVSLSSEAERILIHVNIEASSVDKLAI